MSDSSTTCSAWRADPNERGTFNILVSCISTLFVSVWSSLHLSIPNERLTWRGTLSRKVLWMLIGVLLPEALVAIALHQFITARDIRDKVNNILGFADIPKLSWYKRAFRTIISEFGQDTIGESDSQGFIEEYLNNKAGQIGVKNALGEVVPRRHVWTTAHGFYAMMGGFALGEQSPSRTVVRQIISPNGFLELLHARSDLIPEILPDISENAILAKGKSDGLAKLVLIFQVGWFLFHCLNRFIHNLSLTLLELNTAAHALCSLFIYAIWWYKPLNAVESIIIPDREMSVSLIRSCGPVDIEFEATVDIGVNKSGMRGFVVWFIMVGVLYGAPHLLNWNSSFPKEPEQMLWRAGIVALVISPCFFATFLLRSAFLKRGIFRNIDGVLNVMLIIFSSVYFPANLYIISTGVRQLFCLSPGAFELPNTSWSDYFPHIV